MRLALTVVSPATRQSADIVLEADPETPMGAVAAELGRFANADGAADQFAAGQLYVDFEQVSPRLTLAESPIVDGSVISLGSRDGCVIPEPAGLIDIRVTSGPTAGVIHRLGPGHADIGSGAGVNVRINDQAIPELALHVYVDDQAGCRVAAYEGVTATIDRKPLGAPTWWRRGQQIAIGDTLLGLSRYTPPDTALRSSPDGAGTDFSRPPRLLPRPLITQFALPAPPAPAERRPLPLVMPAGRRAAAARLAEYAERRARIKRDVREALEAERITRREQCPDPATLLAIASGPRRRLWERRRADPDFLLLRVGTADLPSAVELTDPEQGEHRQTAAWSVPDAPVIIPLRERRVIGVAGPADTARGAGRWIVAQAATLHSPNDLRLYILTDPTGKASWEWVRWLPHCRPTAAAGGVGAGGVGAGGGLSCTAQVGNDAETVAARITELLAIVAGRQRELGQQASARQARGRQALSGQAPGQQKLEQFTRGDGRGQIRFRTAIMVVLDGSRALQSLPGVTRLLREGPEVGVYAVCLDSDERLLPAECQAVAVISPDGLRVWQALTAPVPGGRFDHVSPSWCARAARAMAPIRDVSDRDGAARPYEEGCPPGEILIAPVGWAALGRPEPVRPARDPGIPAAPG